MTDWSVIDPPGLSFVAPRNAWTIRRSIGGKQRTFGTFRNREDAVARMDELGFLTPDPDRSPLKLWLDHSGGLPPAYSNALVEAMDAKRVTFVPRDLNARQREAFEALGVSPALWGALVNTVGWQS